MSPVNALAPPRDGSFGLSTEQRDAVIEMLDRKAAEMGWLKHPFDADSDERIVERLLMRETWRYTEARDVSDGIAESVLSALCVPAVVAFAASLHDFYDVETMRNEMRAHFAPLVADADARLTAAFERVSDEIRDHGNGAMTPQSQ